MFYYDETLRHVVYSPARMLGMGTFGDLGDRLDQGQDMSTEFTVDVPLWSRELDTHMIAEPVPAPVSGSVPNGHDG